MNTSKCFDENNSPTVNYLTNSDKIQLFSNPKFGEIRTVDIDSKTYFVGSDIARALGYARPNDAISAHCKGTVKHRISDNQ